ncbi:MAG: hypothetical protein ACFWTZ_08880 [Burkholderia sp.]|jgi:hypothetical protein
MQVLQELPPAPEVGGRDDGPAPALRDEADKQVARARADARERKDVHRAQDAGHLGFVGTPAGVGDEGMLHAEEPQLVLASRQGRFLRGGDDEVLLVKGAVRPAVFVEQRVGRNDRVERALAQFLDERLGEQRLRFELPHAVHQVGDEPRADGRRGRFADAEPQREFLERAGGNLRGELLGGGHQGAALLEEPGAGRCQLEGPHVVLEKLHAELALEPRERLRDRRRRQTQPFGSFLEDAQFRDGVERAQELQVRQLNAHG